MRGHNAEFRCTRPHSINHFIPRCVIVLAMDIGPRNEKQAFFTATVNYASSEEKTARVPRATDNVNVPTYLV